MRGRSARASQATPSRSPPVSRTGCGCGCGCGCASAGHLFALSALPLPDCQGSDCGDLTSADDGHTHTHACRLQRRRKAGTRHPDTAIPAPGSERATSSSISVSGMPWAMHPWARLPLLFPEHFLSLPLLVRLLLLLLLDRSYWSVREGWI